MYFVMPIRIRRKARRKGKYLYSPVIRTVGKNCRSGTDRRKILNDKIVVESAGKLSFAAGGGFYQDFAAQLPAREAASSPRDLILNLDETG